jgi:NADH:ubiquinone oxidoreductase subunit F (NADH-binding)
VSQNLRGLSARKGLDRSLYAATQQALRPEGGQRLSEIAAEFLVSEASLIGASASYDFPQLDQAGKKALLCAGTACRVSGRQASLQAALSGHFSEAEIGHVTCLGHCHRNDAFLYDQATWTREDLALLDRPGAASPAPKAVPTGSLAAPSVLLAPLPPLAAYYAPLLALKGAPASALSKIEASGLRGRGGAGFPFHLKVKAARAAASDQKYVVCNADEGDPGAYSDKWLLEERPHAVLAGMMAIGAIIGADTGVLYIRGEYPESLVAVRAAIGELDARGILGDGRHGTGPAFRFHVIAGSGAYICGEETALLNSIEGLRPEVRVRPPFPTSHGLFGKPTLLSNVETLANLPFILAAGGEAYAAQGLASCTGTKLVSLDGGFNRPGIYEVPMGTSLRQVLDDLGGGTRYPVKAFQIGGPLGGLVPVTQVDSLTLDFEAFAAAGFLLGHAGIVAIPEHFPLAELLANLFAFTARESCGKCFPCRIGARRGQELIECAIHQGTRIDPRLFADLLETLELGSLCALGGGLPLPVRNALTYFGDELAPLFLDARPG